MSVPWPDQDTGRVRQIRTYSETNRSSGPDRWVPTPSNRAKENRRISPQGIDGVREAPDGSLSELPDPPGLREAATAFRSRTTLSMVSGLSDSPLLEQTSKVASLDRQIQVFVIDHLLEIESRKLYLSRAAAHHGICCRSITCSRMLWAAVRSRITSGCCAQPTTVTATRSRVHREGRPSDRHGRCGRSVSGWGIATTRSDVMPS